MSAEKVMFELEPCELDAMRGATSVSALCVKPDRRRRDPGEMCGFLRVDRIFTSGFNSKSKVIQSVVIFVIIIMSAARRVEGGPSSENLESKIKMFLESHCTMQNQSLEQEEFKSFMACGPSHGAGIVKSLGEIPEYRSDDSEERMRAAKKEIISQCEVWPQDRTCQERTYRLIEKCFEKDQKFIFYFMFALTDVICEREGDLFVRFWQDGGDACLRKHIKTLKKDFSECFNKTSTFSNDDVYKNYDEVMFCFRSQFDDDCFGDGATDVLNKIMAEIKRVYRGEMSRSLAPSTSASSAPFFITIFLAGWMTFLVATRQ